MARLVTLKWPTACSDCGAELQVGDQARYYGKGKVYGVSCHDRNGGQRSEGGRCEDAPCCGHGGACDPATLRGDYDYQDESGVWHLA